MTTLTKSRMEVLHTALVEAKTRLGNRRSGAGTTAGSELVKADINAWISSASLVVIRDRVELTTAYIESLNLSQYTPKSTLLFIAREIVVNAPGEVFSGVVFGDYNLIFLADTLDLRHGVWVANEVIAPVDTQGAAGPDVTIMCRDLLGASVISMGGTGGPGKNGKNGKDAEKDCQFHEDIGEVICEYVGPGENGGNGSNGAKGGNGGKITLSYVNDLVQGGFQLSSLGSLPGGGGGGGLKGEGGEGDPDGLDGIDGKTGPAGDAQPLSVSKIPEDTYWLTVMIELGVDDSLATWRETRLRSADYYFRAFRPTPGKSHYLNLARDEAAAVLQLLPTPPEITEANLIRSQIEQNLNVLGLERTAVPKFIDFPRYKQDLLNYEEAIRDKFTDAVGGLLEVEVTQFSIGKVLETQRDHLDSDFLKLQLQKEIAAAEQGKIRTGTLLSEAEKLVTDLQARVKAKEFEISSTLPPGEIKLSNAITLGVFTVGSLAATFLAGPAAGAVAAALLPMAADLLGNSAMGKDMGDTLKNAKDIAEALKAKDEEARKKSLGLNEMAKDPAKAEKDWKEPTFKMVVSLVKVAKDLADAVATGDPRWGELLVLNRELVAVMHQQFLAKLNDNQAGFAKEAADAAEELRVEDLRRVNEALDELTNHDLQIRKGVLAAVHRARSIRNRLLWLVFNAARALDLYTLGYPPSSAISPFVDVNSPATLVRYDYGYLSPSDDAAYLDGTMLHPEFQQKVRESISVLESLEYQTAFDFYREGRAKRIQAGATVEYPRPDKPEERQAALKSFRETQRLFFVLKPEDLRPGRHEAKVTKISLTLEGVQTAQNSFGVIIRHSGRSQQRWLPSEQVNPPVMDQVLPPSEDVIEMKATANGKFFGETIVTQPGENQSILLQSYGRGAAAEWTFEIEEGSGPINLSQLSVITAMIEYESFIEGATADATSLESVVHATGAIYPGATTLATLKLVAPAPENGLFVKLASSNPAAAKVPGGITVPAGATSAIIPIQIAPTAAGASATVSATADFTLHTTVNVPPQMKPVRVLELVRADAQGGQNVVVRGLAADDRFVYAPYFLAPKDNITLPAELGFLAVIDIATWAVKHRIPVGDQPVSVAVHNNAQRRRLFVVNRGPKSTNLSVIDLAVDGKTFKSLPPVQMHAGIWDVAVHQASNRAYVTRTVAGSIYVIDALATDPAKLLLETVTTTPGIQSLTIDQAANRIYLVRSVQNATEFVERIELFDPVQRTFTPLALPVLPVRSGPADVAFDPDGRLYISNLGNTPTGVVPPNVTVLDMNADDVTSVQTLSGAWMIAVDPDRNQVYAPTREGLELIARSNQGGAPYRVALRLAAGPSPRSVAVHPLSGEVYIGDSVDGSVRAAPPVDAGTMVEWH